MKWELNHGEKLSRYKKENKKLTKRKFEVLKEFSLKKTLKIVEKSTKWRYISIKKKKLSENWEKIMEMKENQPKMDTDLKTR